MESRCFHDVGFAADHLAVTPFETPDATAGADIDVVDALGGEFLGAANVVDVIGVAAVDDDVADIELASEFVSVASTTPAGTMSHTARGLLSFLASRRARSNRLHLLQRVV